MLDPLATTADLTARNITVPAGVDATTILASATDAVRDAAGCPITVTSSTVDLVSCDFDGLDLPGGPVSAVASVSVEGVVIAQSTLGQRCYSQGWRKVGNRLLFSRVLFTPPAIFTVTYTHGFPIVPADIVDLVCAMAAMAFDQDYGTAGRLGSVKLSEYAETFVHPAGTESPSPVAVPDSVRQRLRERFGTSVAVIGTTR